MTDCLFRHKFGQMAMNFPGHIGSVESPKLPHVCKRFQRRIGRVHEPVSGNAQSQIAGQSILNKNIAVDVSSARRRRVRPRRSRSPKPNSTRLHLFFLNREIRRIHEPRTFGGTDLDFSPSSGISRFTRFSILASILRFRVSCGHRSSLRWLGEDL